MHVRVEKKKYRSIIIVTYIIYVCTRTYKPNQYRQSTTLVMFCVVQSYWTRPMVSVSTEPTTLLQFKIRLSANQFLIEVINSTVSGERQIQHTKPCKHNFTGEFILQARFPELLVIVWCYFNKGNLIQVKPYEGIYSEQRVLRIFMASLLGLSAGHHSIRHINIRITRISRVRCAQRTLGMRAFFDGIRMKHYSL